jgi:hypothetical protein
MALLLAAGMNAVAFLTGPYQGVSAWNVDVASPWTARASAVLSMVLWLSIIACGRSMGYL